MPTKAKSQESAYSQALNQNKSIGRGKETQDPESQADTQLWRMVFGVKTGREVWGRGSIRIGFAKEQSFQSEVKELWRDRKR